MFNVIKWNIYGIHYKSTFPLRYLPFDQLNVAGKRVLDYGCGEGRLLKVLSEMDARVTGVDVSLTMLWRAKRAAGRVQLIWLPLVGVTRLRFQLAFCISTLSSLENTFLQELAMRKLASLLFPNSKLVFADFGWWPGENIGQPYRATSGLSFMFFDSKRLKDMLRCSGFSILDFQELKVPTTSGKVRPAYLVIAQRGNE